MLWAYLAVLVLLAFLWTRFERFHQGLKRGLHLKSLGREGTTRLVVIGQGITSILLFAMMVGAFILFGWKVGIAAVLAGFGVGAFFS